MALSESLLQMASQTAASGPRRTALPSRPPRELGGASGKARAGILHSGDGGQAGSTSGDSQDPGTTDTTGYETSVYSRTASPTPVPTIAESDAASSSDAVMDFPPIQGQSGQVCR